MKMEENIKIGIRVSKNTLQQTNKSKKTNEITYVDIKEHKFFVKRLFEIKENTYSTESRELNKA